MSGLRVCRDGRERLRRDPLPEGGLARPERTAGPSRSARAVLPSVDDRDRDRDHTTVIKEREPTDRTTVIKKENEDGTRSKTIIHDND